MSHRRRRLVLAAGVAGLGSARLAGAHGTADHASPAAAPRKEQKDWGIAGDARAATRRIDVRMLDTMRFAPARIDVRQGETLRLHLHNAGRLMHEFVIGTPEANAAHAALMLQFPGMEHDEPYMAHVPPGRTAELVWLFNRAGRFEFACLIAGHYQAGMVGAIHVAPAARG